MGTVLTGPAKAQLVRPGSVQPPVERVLELRSGNRGRAAALYGDKQRITYDATAVPNERLEILRLRARVVALERAVLAALELVLRLRPEELNTGLELARHLLEDNYLDSEFAAEITNPVERTFLAQEVDRLMRGLQSEMGFKQGRQAPEEG